MDIAAGKRLNRSDQTPQIGVFVQLSFALGQSPATGKIRNNIKRILP